MLDVAWRLVREEGSDALTLARLADQAGVTKPIVYDHFITRSGLLAALYQDFDARQTALMDAALDASDATLQSRAAVIASSYVECVLLQGREIPGVIAALTSTPELERIKREYEGIFPRQVPRRAGTVRRHERHHPGRFASDAGGAAEALSNAAATGEISAGEAKEELLVSIVAMVNRTVDTPSS
nr:TetR/AcrR family transcriptional regulator [Pseudomonas brassicacearum subsp. brassicacearum]